MKRQGTEIAKIKGQNIVLFKNNKIKVKTYVERQKN